MSTRRKPIEVREQEEATASPPEDDALLKKISEADGVPELYNWITSPELQSLK
jgi:hypothetical protein